MAANSKITDSVKEVLFSRLIAFGYAADAEEAKAFFQLVAKGKLPVSEMVESIYRLAVKCSTSERNEAKYFFKLATECELSFSEIMEFVFQLMARGSLYKHNTAAYLCRLFEDCNLTDHQMAEVILRLSAECNLYSYEKAEFIAQLTPVREGTDSQNAEAILRLTAEVKCSDSLKARLLLEMARRLSLSVNEKANFIFKQPDERRSPVARFLKELYHQVMTTILRDAGYCKIVKSEQRTLQNAMVLPEDLHPGMSSHLRIKTSEPDGMTERIRISSDVLPKFRKEWRNNIDSVLSAVQRKMDTFGRCICELFEEYLQCEQKWASAIK